MALGSFIQAEGILDLALNASASCILAVTPAKINP